MDTTSIGIIGAGELGLALGHAFERDGAHVLYYDREDDRTTTATIGDLVNACNVLMACVPAMVNREVVRGIAKCVNPQNPPVVISLSKGVESGFVTMDQVLHDTLPQGTPYGIIYGPMLANEIIAHQLASGAVAVSELGYVDMLRNLFAKARIYLEVSSDMHGTAMSGALKNVYAMAFGMSDGLKLGANARGRLCVMVLREMKRMLQSVGAQPETAEGLAGLGDLVAAGAGESSFNYRVGRSIVEGIADEKVKSEGLSTLKEMPHVVKIEDYPLIQLMDKMIYHYENPQAFRALLQK
jgi:glycerol-3-phosphate dehydrogenase (NAD(P)+)